jgi:microcystin-dependent protein
MNWTNDFITPHTTKVFTSEQTNENRVSAKNLNYLGSQLAAGEYLIDHHNHGDQYYTKEEENSKYYSDTNKIGSDADTIEGYHFSDLIGSALPKYSIIMWEDPVIPTGYAVCNGQVISGVSTIDMRDYFIPCAGNTYTLSQTFGNDVVSYSGSISINNHTLTESEIPSHTHTYYDIYGVHSNLGAGNYAAVGAWLATSTGSAGRNSGATGGGQGHNHTGSITLNQDVDNRPSYYSLYFIEKVVD